MSFRFPSVVSLSINLRHFPSVCVTSQSLSLSLSISLYHFPSVCGLILGYGLSHHSMLFPISLSHFSSISAYALFHQNAVSHSISLRHFPSTWVPSHLYESLPICLSHFYQCPPILSEQFPWHSKFQRIIKAQTIFSNVFNCF